MTDLSKHLRVWQQVRMLLALVLQQLGLGGVLLVTPRAAVGVCCDAAHRLRECGVWYPRYLRNTTLHRHSITIVIYPL